jgi:hypothetical protein
MAKKKSNKEVGGAFEERVYKTIMSGALTFQKSDITTKDLCIECKYTDKKGFRITTQILDKLWNSALEANKLPMLIIGIKDDKYMWQLKCDITKENI